MKKPEGDHLVLLFTYGISLGIWRRQGLIDREVGYYRHLHAQGIDAVTFVTYDPRDAEPPLADVAPFAVAARPRRIGCLIYSLLAPVLRRDVFSRATIVKSNQSRGAWAGIVAKLLHPHVLFVVRCGWVRTRTTMRQDEKLGWLWIRWAEAVERMTFRAADTIFVVTPGDKAYVEQQYGIAEGKIHVMPNVVDTELFAPSAGPAPRRDRARILSVGRLVEHKNVQGLIQAAALLARPVDVVVVGDGPHRTVLERQAAAAGVNVQFRLSLPNREVAQELRAADLFVLPEVFGCGMPKVLIEAMASGVLTIATDVWPHGEVIQDGVNGLLCAATPEGISAAIARALAMSDQERRRITARARHEAVDRYSMSSLAAREAALYRSMRAPSSAPIGQAVR